MQLHWALAKVHIPNCGQVKIKNNDRLLLMQRDTPFSLSFSLSLHVKDAGRHFQAHSDNTLPDTHKSGSFFSTQRKPHRPGVKGAQWV